MQIKALWPALIIVAGCTNGVAQESRAAPSDDVAEVQSAGELTSRDYNLSGFNQISLMTPDNVEIVQGATFSVRATGDVRILDEPDEYGNDFFLFGADAPEGAHGVCA